MERVVVCHADQWSQKADERAFLLALGRRGVTLSFDCIGLHCVSDVVLINPSLNSLDNCAEPVCDSTIAACIASLIHDHQLIQQILVSTNVLQRIQLQRYGGGGYGHTLERFRGRLIQDHNITANEWKQLIWGNPLRLLKWYTPPPVAEIPKHYLRCSICTNAFEPIVGEYFTKFSFVYCGTKCLRQHSKRGFDPL